MSTSDITRPCPIEFPGVNAVAICDCGCISFMIGLEVDLTGNNHIRVAQCGVCGHKLAVPFFHDHSKDTP